MQKAEKQITLLGKQTRVDLHGVTFDHIMDIWGVEDKRFDVFRDRYKNYCLIELCFCLVRLISRQVQELLFV